MALSMQGIMKKMKQFRYPNVSMGKGGRGKGNPGRSFAQPMPGGTPGANNPTTPLRRRTTSQGKSVVPVKAKTPVKTKQKNPKGKRSVKSTPVGYKNAKLRDNKGGNPMPKVANKRGGYGAARANLGFAGATGPIRSVIGKSR